MLHAKQRSFWRVPCIRHALYLGFSYWIQSGHYNIFIPMILVLRSLSSSFRYGVYHTCRTLPGQGLGWSGNCSSRRFNRENGPSPREAWTLEEHCEVEESLGFAMRASRFLLGAFASNLCEPLALRFEPLYNSGVQIFTLGFEPLALNLCESNHESRLRALRPFFIETFRCP